MTTAADLNEDWLRTRTWDLWHRGSLVADRAGLEGWLSDHGYTLEHFLTLPAARAMPESIRAELGDGVKHLPGLHDQRSHGRRHARGGLAFGRFDVPDTDYMFTALSISPEGPSYKWDKDNAIGRARARFAVDAVGRPGDSGFLPFRTGGGGIDYPVAFGQDTRRADLLEPGDAIWHSTGGVGIRRAHVVHVRRHLADPNEVAISYRIDDAPMELDHTIYRQRNEMVPMPQDAKAWLRSDGALTERGVAHELMLYEAGRAIDKEANKRAKRTGVRTAESIRRELKTTGKEWQDLATEAGTLRGQIADLVADARYAGNGGRNGISGELHLQLLREAPAADYPPEAAELAPRLRDVVDRQQAMEQRRIKLFKDHTEARGVYTKAYREAVLELLSEVRPMGPQGERTASERHLFDLEPGDRLLLPGPVEDMEVEFLGLVEEPPRAEDEFREGARRRVRLRYRRLEDGEEVTSLGVMFDFHTIRVARPEGASPDVLDVTGMAGNWAPDDKAAENIHLASRFYPRDWIRASARDGRIQVSGDPQRGYYDDRNDIIAAPLEGTQSAVPEDPPGFRVAVHELAHRMEHLVPAVKAAETAFHTRRTTPEVFDNGVLQLSTQEATVPMNTLKGGLGYGPDEKARPDDFPEPYMGKVYTGDFGSSWEQMSMGMEALFTGTYDLDEDYRAFVLGTLALL